MSHIQRLKGLWQFKMNLTLIAAISENNVMGNKGKIPWRIKEDMKRFRELTLNHPVIMGRKTYESIPEKFKPLPDRKNIVLSKSMKDYAGIYIARNTCEALSLSEGKSSYVIGGREIYEEFLPFTYKIELTRVHRNYEGDVFFPKINWDMWKIINEEKNISENGIPFSFLTYERII
ncbi:Dihydrofolate reductase HdrB [uncultured archaeon]|nr:Dihydrofolate reductase HdrB [uncultured archaeon]